jgi:hypothetical protein
MLNKYLKDICLKGAKLLACFGSILKVFEYDEW